MKSYLLFELGGVRYAVPSGFVLELVEFPALSGWPGARDEVLGVVDFRGRVLPVIDLNVLLGGRSQSPSEHDQLLVVEADQVALAILINQAEELRTLPVARLDEANAPPGLTQAKRFLKGVVQADGRVVLVVNLFEVIQSLDLQPPPHPHPQKELVHSQDGNLSETLLARAAALAQAPKIWDDDHRTHLLLVHLAGERLGLGVADVREITPYPKVTPVPGTPPFLLGLGYHRGDPVRVVDIREKCGLSNGPSSFGNLVIVQGRGMLTGIAVEGIDSVVAASEIRGDRASYQGRWLSVLDLEKLQIEEPVSFD